MLINCSNDNDNDNAFTFMNINTLSVKGSEVLYNESQEVDNGHQPVKASIMAAVICLHIRVCCIYRDTPAYNEFATAYCNEKYLDLQKEDGTCTQKMNVSMNNNN